MSDSTLVLVHGAWHDSRCWEPLVHALGDYPVAIHTPDLPGHGENALEMAEINLNVYSNYISQFIDNINKKVILIGHSMSGVVISQVAENIPDSIQRLVYLCAYLPQDGQSIFDLIAVNREEDTIAPIEKVMQMSSDKRSCNIPPDQIPGLFYNRCPDTRQDCMPRQFPPQAVLPLSGHVTLSETGFGSVPLSYICCLDDQVIPIRHQRLMLKRQPCGEMIQLDADHSPFLSCPDTLASILHSVSLEV